MSVLELEDVSFQYNPGKRNEYRALDGVSLSAERGETVGIIGQSGSGKTTLLLVAGLLTQPGSGRVMVGGHDASVLDESRRRLMRKRYISFIPQKGGLVVHWTALENVVYMARQTGHRIKKKHARQLLERLEIKDKAVKAFPHQLSGGEYQRVVTAVAVAKHPAIIVADEPTSALDSENSDRVMELLVGMAKHNGVTLVVVSHNRELIWARADKVYEMADGRISSPADNRRMP